MGKSTLYRMQTKSSARGRSRFAEDEMPHNRVYSCVGVFLATSMLWLFFLKTHKEHLITIKY